MTPAEEIAAAAEKLAPLAEAAQKSLDTEEYWAHYPKATAWHDGLTNGMGGTSGDLAGAIPPAAVTELVRWLRAESRRLSYGSHPGWQDIVSPHAVALARIILGGPR